MESLAIINPENVSEIEVNSYPVRNAARAVVIDADNLIGLLYVANGQYYKIPGGGIEEGEDRELALGRECREEIGCNIEVIGEIGYISEYRKMFSLKQISYCYFAKVRGEKSKPDFTEEEIRNGFKIVWLPYNEALDAISNSKARTSESSLYMVPRDTRFLEEAGKFIFR